MRMEQKFLTLLRQLASDCDRKIKRGQERIALNAPSTAPNPGFVASLEKRKEQCATRVKRLPALFFFKLVPFFQRTSHNLSLFMIETTTNG